MNFRSIRFYFIKTVFYIGLTIIFYCLFLNFFDSFYKNSDIAVSISGSNMGNTPVQIFYAAEGEEYSGERTVCYSTNDLESFINIGAIEMPLVDIHKLRIDIGDNAEAEAELKSVKYRNYYGIYSADAEEIYDNMLGVNDMVAELEGDVIKLKATGNDPYIDLGSINLVKYRNHNTLWAVLAAIVSALIFNRFVKLKSVYAMGSDLWTNRRLIFALAGNDFKTKFAGSYFGIIWAFIQPVCTILVFWFVFQVGFRNPNVGDVEYILWFSTGLIPWFFFSDSWSTATNSFLDYSYLVKKVVFKINILPMIKIISALFVHVFFIGFMFVLYALYGRVPSIYAIQLIYYMFCMIMLVIAMSFITAPLILFFRDLGQLMNIVLQFGMWLTPIMWSVNNLPDNLKWVMTFFKINPMYYIVQGYRDSMIYDVWFYSNIKQTLYFWIVVTVLMIVGSTLYRRLKPHFADVL